MALLILALLQRIFLMSSLMLLVQWFIFFFQAEDGIRDLTVTGVQTCALPISRRCPPCGSSCPGAGPIRPPADPARPPPAPPAPAPPAPPARARCGAPRPPPAARGNRRRSRHRCCLPPGSAPAR